MFGIARGNAETTLFKKMEEALLFMSDESSKESESVNSPYQDVRRGNYCKVLNSEVCQLLFTPDALYFEKDSLEKILDETARKHFSEHFITLPKQHEVLLIGVSSFLAFVQSNWTGPEIQPGNVLPWLRKMETPERPLDEESRLCLIKDAEGMSPAVKFPEFLLLAGIALKLCVSKVPGLMSANWWLMRYLFYHQKILDEFSVEIHGSIMEIMDDVAIIEPMLSEDNRVQFHLELAQIHLYYLHYTKANMQLNEAQSIAEVTIELTGALGKRTRYQEHDLAQLILNVSTFRLGQLHSTVEVKTGDMPENLTLDDEVRLNEIKFLDPSLVKPRTISLSAQALVLGKFFQRLRSTPFHNLAFEELLPYLSCILSQRHIWAYHMVALLFRCRLEGEHSRTLERSQFQMLTLVESIASTTPPPAFRLAKLFTSHLPPYWKIQDDLVGLQLKLGLVESALEISTALQNWPRVIACHFLLRRRHKATEVIQQELEKKETVKLWCLLGDATDNIQCYEKAWILSGYRSALAQKHWGMYFYQRKKYVEAIPYFRKSLEYNSLQVVLWLRLAYSALAIEDWELCASAYRHHCSLDPEDFQAWNNLSKAYIKMGQKQRAFMTLREAIKCNYEVWQVWDNLMAVSIDCGEFDEVIRCYHRILDLKGKHSDTQVLGILVNAIVHNLKDGHNVPACKYRKKTLILFGRLTGMITNNSALWKLYAKLSASIEHNTAQNLQKTVQYLKNAYNAAIQDTSWEKDFPSCTEVMLLCISIADAHLKCCEICPDVNATEVLTSAKLILKSVLTKITKEHTEIRTGEIVEILNEPFMQLEHKLMEIMRNIEQIRKCKARDSLRLN